MALPQTLRASHTMIRQLKNKVKILEKQTEADSQAMNGLCDAVNHRDQLLLEKCKTCGRNRVS